MKNSIEFQRHVVVDVLLLPHGQGLDLPKYSTEGAAGLDLRAALIDSINVEPGSVVLVPTGLCIALPPEWEGQVRSRSSLAVQGVLVANSPGTVDSDFRGEIKVVLINHSLGNFKISRGDRIAQLIVAPVGRVFWSPVQALQSTTRHDHGFGSTGKE